MHPSSNKEKNNGTYKVIAKNSFFIITSRVVEFGAGLLVLVLIANHFGVQDFGEFSFIRAVAFILSPLVAFGSLRIIVRDISVAKERTSEILIAGFALNLLMAIVVAAVLAGLVIILPAFGLKSTTQIASLYLAIIAETCLAMKNTVHAGFFAHEIAHFAALTNIIGRLLVVASVVVVIWLRQNLVILFFAIAFANLAGVGITLFVLKLTRIITSGSKRVISNLVFLFKESFPIMIVVFMGQGYIYVNTFFLRFFHDNWHVAMFESSQRIIIPLSMVSTSILLAFVPTLSRMGRNIESHEELLQVYRNTLKFFFLTTFPICAIAAVAAKPIILTIYNDDFSPAAKSLQILIWTMIPLFANSLLNFVLTSLYKQRLLLISNTLCFLVNAALSWALVKDFSYIGVSFAALIANIVLFFINYHFVSVVLGRARLYSMTIIPGLVSLFFYYPAVAMITVTLNRILWMVLFVIVYFFMLWGTRIITVHEITSLLNFRKKKPLDAGTGSWPPKNDSCLPPKI